MLFGWGERKVIKTKNLTPQTNPLGTRRCFVHPWRLGGSLSGGVNTHPWSWRALLLGGQFPTLGRPPLPLGRVASSAAASGISRVRIFRTRVPPLACVKAGTCAGR